MTAPVDLLVSDVDGTLVRSDKSLSDRVVAAAGRLRAAGVAMALISSRPPSGIRWLADRLGLQTPIAAFNGGTIVAADGTVIAADRLAARVAERALGLIDRPGVIPWLFFEGRWHAAAEDPLHMPREVKSANQQPIVGGDLAALAGGADKIVVVCDDHAMLAALEAEVAKALGGDATVARSQPYYLDITAPTANKGVGIERLARAIGVSLARTAAIGDQRNDLPMFARAGLSIAMGQGPDEVRAAADRVTAPNDEDGVAKAIDTIILPEVS